MSERSRSAVTVKGVDVVGYADLRLQEKTAIATVNRELAALRRAYRLAIRQGLLMTMAPITTFREDNVRAGFFEADQFEIVCRRLRDVEADIARFCYQTGWRTKSVVFPLTWPQVDWTGGLVRLEPGTTKNREGREPEPVIYGSIGRLDRVQAFHADTLAAGAVALRLHPDAWDVLREWVAGCITGELSAYVVDLRQELIRELYTWMLTGGGMSPELGDISAQSDDRSAIFARQWYTPFADLARS